MAARRALRWLLLLLTQVPVMARVRAEQPAQRGCSPDEYWSPDRWCCQLCPAGEFVSKACVSPHTRGSCEKCEPGTFTAFANGLPACRPCSTCREDQEPVVECASARDRACQCRSGHFHPAREASESCSPCTKCPPTEPVLLQCNATADTVCSSDASSERHHLWWLLSVPPVLAVIIFGP